MTDLREVGKGLPHRYPFHMIDRVIEFVPGLRAVAVKAISSDDFFLSNHVPGRPSMPEVLIVEALAQTGGIALLSAREGGTAVLVGVEQMEFNKTVGPGARLTLWAEVEFRFGGMAKVRVRAEADSALVAQGILVLAEGER